MTTLSYDDAAYQFVGRGITAASFGAAFLAGATLRLYLASLGHNHDLESFVLVARAMLEDGSVYGATARYNYGPAWASILYALVYVHHFAYGLVSWANEESFHVVIAGFLTVVDGALAAVLSWRLGCAAGMSFFLLPVGVLLTGFHSQFDNLAILLALVSWLMIEKAPAQAGPSVWVISAVALGFSLIVKHVFFFFPIWILFYPALGRLRRRVAYVAITYATFAAGFCPWIFDSASRAAVLANVLGYRGVAGGILPMVAGLLLGTNLSHVVFEVLWVVVLAHVGWIVMGRESAVAPYIYVVVFTALAPAFADQYLAIPLIACTRFWRLPATYVYLACGTVVLLLSPFNVGQGLLYPPTREAITSYRPVLYLLQVPLLFLLISAVWRIRHCSKL